MGIVGQKWVVNDSLEQIKLKTRADFNVLDTIAPTNWAQSAAKSIFDTLELASPVAPTIKAFEQEIQLPNGSTATETYIGFGLEGNLSVGGRLSALRDAGILNPMVAKWISKSLPSIAVGGSWVTNEAGQSLSELKFTAGLPQFAGDWFDRWKKSLTYSGKLELDLPVGGELSIKEWVDQTDPLSRIDVRKAISFKVGYKVLATGLSFSFDVTLNYDTQSVLMERYGTQRLVDFSTLSLSGGAGFDQFVAATGLGTSMQEELLRAPTSFRGGTGIDIGLTQNVKTGALFVGPRELAEAEYTPNFEKYRPAGTVDFFEDEELVVTGLKLRDVVKISPTVSYNTKTHSVWGTENGEIFNAYQQLDNTGRVTGSAYSNLKSNGDASLTIFNNTDLMGPGVEAIDIFERVSGNVTLNGVAVDKYLADILNRHWSIGANDEIGEPVSPKISRNADGNIETVVEVGGRTRRIEYLPSGVKHTSEDGANFDVYSSSTETEIRIRGNKLAFDFSDAGAILGQVLGQRLAGSDELAGIVSSAALRTIGNNLGDAVDELVGKGKSVRRALEDGFASFGPELMSNLESAGIGALSSFLTAELVKSIGLDGFAAGIGNAAAGSAIGTIISNIAAGANLGNAAELFHNVNLATIGVAVGSFLGTKLANEIHEFDTIGGQIGSAVGTAAFLALDAVYFKAALASGNPVVIGVAVVVAALDALLGGLIGGFLGSIFGGTPRSGADASWDASENRFVVQNVWSRKDGSKDTARSLATSVTETLNVILSASGGLLLDPASVQSGSYGMVKSNFVYRPRGGGSDQDTITKEFGGKDGASNLVGYGIYSALTDSDFQIVGGNIYVKRAIYNSLSSPGVDPNKFQANSILANIASATSYEKYLAESSFINTLIASQPDSVFSAEIALTLARATELGLTRRAASDWFGGFSQLFKAGESNAATTNFGFDYDPSAGQISRQISSRQHVAGDTIDVAGQTSIEGTSAGDVIDLRTGSLTNQIGLTVDAHLNDDIAVSAVDFTPLSTAVSFGASELRKTVSVSLNTDTLAEENESFIGRLTGAAQMQTMGSDAVATIIDDASALATLMVGNSFAWEGDGYAVFRLSLSKAATSTVTVALALADGRATGGGVDFGAGLEVSSDGITWTAATSATLAIGDTELFVRTVVVTDNGVDGEGHATNVEGNEKFTLNATVTSGASALANGADTVSGTGTIVDGAGTEPLVWIDNVVVHEASGTAVFTISRSRTAASATTVDFATADRREVKIDVAATVDGGGGDDTIYASNLGDNIFGGAGNDTLYGGRLDDWLLGGDGNDTLDAGTADPNALGGDGNYLNGGAGNDIVKGREGSDWLEGGAGVDILTGGAGDDILSGGADDNDLLYGGSGDDQYLIRLGDGADIAEDEAPDAPVADPGYSGDYISQRFARLAAFDIEADWTGLYTPGIVNRKVSGGDDSIIFGQGISIGDVVLKRDPTDRDNLLVLVMQTNATTGAMEFSGTQLIVKDWFSDPFKRVEWLKFADGNAVRIGDVTSFVIGGSGNDVLIGTLGNDFVYGGAGNDRLFLLAGDDIGNGGTGNDLLLGDSGNDLKRQAARRRWPRRAHRRCGRRLHQRRR